MTKLGEYLAKKSVNKSMVARKTGLSKARINELTMTDSAKLRLDEMYLIALAIDTDPCEMMKILCADLSLDESDS
ncbi:XRE family transcriptional regulator [Sphingobacterium olei]|uniref:XRE family transcriptional regulator n=1 Tax=Sphingobacterium olei TaxID=2571155 RepID=A0A4V5MMK8_9SPHI|nr:helix-turn-helix domain-containing protein [Sphingobacterium olei]TJZ61288.1 XRE family transcriptional regulator [Sphingobacterium olei]